jgi:hypothetical protein
MLTSGLSEDRIRQSIEIVTANTRGAPHEIVGQFAVSRGDDAATVAASVRRMAALGATTVLVHGTDDEPDPVGFTEWVGAEVRPRVTA